MRMATQKAYAGRQGVSIAQHSLNEGKTNYSEEDFFIWRKSLTTRQDRLKLAICLGKSVAQRGEPAPCPFIFHGENGKPDEEEKHAGKHRQKQPYRAQKKQSPTRHDKCHTLYHLPV